jgi:hypothetical protein
MKSRHRPRVSLGDAVGPLNSTPPSLINIDSEVDDPLLSFTSERPPTSSAPDRALASFTPERSPSPLAMTLDPAAARSPMLGVAYRRDPWAQARPKGVSGSVVVAFLVLGILIGFAGGYTSVMFKPPGVAPSGTTPARADAPAPLSAASVGTAAADAPAPHSAASAGTDTTQDTWEQVPVGRQVQGPAAVEADSGTASNELAPTPNTAGTVASAVATLGSIDVVSRPPGAEVAIDGRVVGTTPLSIPDVTEGTHVVGIELAGFSRWATSVHVSKGERARVGASLTP